MLLAVSVSAYCPVKEKMDKGCAKQGVYSKHSVYPWFDVQDNHWTKYPFFMSHKETARAVAGCCDPDYSMAYKKEWFNQYGMHYKFSKMKKGVHMNNFCS